LPYEDFTNLTDLDYACLSPLVPEGENREAILNEVVRKWIEETNNITGALKELQHSFEVIEVFDKIEAHTATLRRIDFRDDNPGADPIDLGKLLCQFEAQLVHHLFCKSTGGGTGAASAASRRLPHPGRAA